MICSSENRFFTSNLRRLGNWTPNRRATQNRGDVAGTQSTPKPHLLACLRWRTALSALRGYVPSTRAAMRGGLCLKKQPDGILVRLQPYRIDLCIVDKARISTFTKVTESI